MKPNITVNKLAGFTLIEIIVAMTLLSLILVLLFSAIFAANRNWQATERKIKHNEQLRLVGHFIQRQISQNIPLIWVAENSQRLIFSGTNNELNFTATLPAHRGGGGVQLITLKINETSNVRQLDLYYRYMDPDNSPFETPDNIKQVTLLKNIDNMEIAYFGQARINQVPRWQNEWHHTAMLPTLIRLKIRPANEPQDWPEIKIPLHVTYHKNQPQFILHKTKKHPI